MNRLKQLRTRAGITIKQLCEYTKIRGSSICEIENGKQPMRELHVLKLTSFFDVTSDYLLGYSNTGIGIHFESSEDDNDHVFISERELNALMSEHDVCETLFINSNSLDMRIILPEEEIRSYTGSHKIYRSVNVSKENANISTSVRDQIIAELNRLDTRELEKVLKFINEYIK